MRQPDNPPAFCRVNSNGRPLIRIMWVIFDHLRPSGHIMPDHAGDRGAVLPVLAPHDHLHINHECASSPLRVALRAVPDRPVLLGSLRWSCKPHRRAERRLLAHRLRTSPDHSASFASSAACEPSRIFAAAVGLPQRDTCTQMPQFCAISRSNGRSHRRSGY